MKRVFAQYKNWLLPAVLILFILQAVTFPFALGKSWAGGSEMPDHLLTFNMRGRLVWDSETEVDGNGVAQLNLFASKYGDPVTVESADGSKLVAPGTNKETIVRLYNKFINTIVYKVVLYQYQENIPEDINMREKMKTQMAAIDGKGFLKDETPVFPEDVDPETVEVVKVITGKMSAHNYQDFDINWLWDFEAEGKDGEDTLLGNLAAAGKDPSTTLGLYIVAQLDTSATGSGDGSGDVITPESPKTGDSGIGAYLGLMAVCGGMLMLLLWEKRKARKCGD